MNNVPDVNTFLGLGTLAGFILAILVIVLQHRQKGDLIAALTELGIAANTNTKALDLIEPLAMKVVPASLVRGLNQAIDLAETAAPDDADALLEQIRSLINRSTDGKANTSGADQTNSQVVQG